MLISIPRAVPADAGALSDLLHASAAYSGQYASILDGYVVTHDQIERDIMFLAEAEDAVAGFYSLTLIGEPELDLMFVSDKAQGTGLGLRLFDHMRNEARGLNISTIKIVSHPPSAGFYKRMGALVIGTKAPTTKVTWERPILSLAV